MTNKRLRDTIRLSLAVLVWTCLAAGFLFGAYVIISYALGIWAF